MPMSSLMLKSWQLVQERMIVLMKSSLSCKSPSLWKLSPQHAGPPPREHEPTQSDEERFSFLEALVVPEKKALAQPELQLSCDW